MVVTKSSQRPAVQRKERTVRGTVAERFWAKVDTSAGPDGCWPWTAFTHPINGYGFFRVSSDRSMVHAHRVAYELATGEQLGKLHIDHRCRNRKCVNPRHLRPVTHKQNHENRGVRSGSKSGIRGVSWDGRCWMARVTHNGQSFYVGKFASKEAAGEAARRKRLGRFTRSDGK